MSKRKQDSGIGKLDVPVRSAPDYSSIKHILERGTREALKEYYEKKAQIRKEWEEERFRICARCAEKKYRELFTGDSKYCKKCVHEKSKRRKQKRKIYRYRGETKVAYHAKNAVYHMKKMGVLVEGPCEVCGSNKVEAHHVDYNKPWEVMWLCRKHHNEWHRENKPKKIEK